jgi:Fe-S-cluster containining protein
MDAPAPEPGPAEPAEFGDYEFEGLPRSESNLRWLQSHLECTGCAQCCRRHIEGLRLTYDEAEGLAEYSGQTREEFLKDTNQFPEYCLIPQPCRYLEGNRCRVQAIKPSVCLNYPFHHTSVQGVPSKWVILTACPAGKKLIGLILSGPQPELEYSQ